MSLQKLIDVIRIDIEAGQETGMNSDILKLCEAAEVMRSGLDDVSILNNLGPYEAIRGPRIAEEVISKADQICGDGK